MTAQTTTLSSGDDLPTVGVGTYDIAGETVTQSVRAALEAGYAHVDTAEGYGNEAEIGEAIADYDRSPAQIVLKWALERDAVVLPRSSSPEHVRANRDLFGWSIEAADLARLDDLDRNEPVYDHPARDWTDDVYGIAE